MDEPRMAGKHFVFYPTQWNNQTIFFQPHYKNNGPTNIKIYKGRIPVAQAQIMNKQKMQVKLAVGQII